MSATMLATVGVIVAMLATAEAKAVGAVPHMDTTGCSLVLRPGPLMDREPLFLQPGGSLNVFGFVDADAKGLVTLAKGQQVLMACPGSLVGNLKEELLAECDSDTNFIIDGKSTALTDLNCNKHPDYLDEATGGSCGAGGRATHAVIGHRTAAGIVQIMEVCFYEPRLESLWAMTTVRAYADGAESGVDRPSFIGGNLFPEDVNPDYQYKRTTQQITFGKLLGSQELALSYIHNTSDYFLTRGHLAAKADFIWAQPQRATHFFSNAAPQWQTFNGGNWEHLESSIRNEATVRERDLLVITGTWGQATLPDINGNPVPLSLLEDGRIPVPALYWRVVYENATGLGVAFVGVNNPYVTLAEEPNLVLCNDVCSQITWVKWSPESVREGEGYCCEVDELKKVVTDMPAITVKGLMV